MWFIFYYYFLNFDLCLCNLPISTFVNAILIGLYMFKMSLPPHFVLQFLVQDLTFILFINKIFFHQCLIITLGWLNVILSHFYKAHYAITVKEGRKEMFYLTTHSTHFIYGYMASDIFRLTANGY